MKKTISIPLFSLLCFVMSPRLQAGETPVPPEVTALAESFVAALKAGDPAAALACWHTAEALVKPEGAVKPDEAATSPSSDDNTKQAEEKREKQEENLKRTAERIAAISGILKLDQLKLGSVDLDDDDNSTPEKPSVDSIELHLTGADGLHLVLEVDSAAQLGGTWKFLGRLDDEIDLQLPKKK